MELLALLLIVLLVTLVWVVVVPYERGEAPVQIEMPRPSDFAAELVQDALRHRVETGRVDPRSLLQPK